MSITDFVHFQEQNQGHQHHLVRRLSWYCDIHKRNGHSHDQLLRQSFNYGGWHRWHGHVQWREASQESHHVPRLGPNRRQLRGYQDSIRVQHRRHTVRLQVLVWRRGLQHEMLRNECRVWPRPVGQNRSDQGQEAIHISAVSRQFEGRQRNRAPNQCQIRLDGHPVFEQAETRIAHISGE